MNSSNFMDTLFVPFRTFKQNVSTPTTRRTRRTTTKLLSGPLSRARGQKATYTAVKNSKPAFTLYIIYISVYIIIYLSPR